MKNILSHYIKTLSIGFVLLFANSLSVFAQEPIGIWWTENKKAKIEIYKTKKGTYDGKIIWVKEQTDKAQQRKGFVLLRNFKKEDDDTYTNGSIVHPKDSKTYNGIITMKSSTELNLRGYIGAALFGKTQTWTKAE